MRLLHALPVIALLSAGCSISAVTDQSLQPTKNVCKTSDDCGSGGVCTDGMCRAVQGKFSTVMFEITPPATSSGGFAGIRFLKTVHGLDTHGGKLDLSVDNVTELGGTFVPTKADFQVEAGCHFDTGKATDQSVPGKVTVTSSAGSLGWPSGTATVETSLAKVTGPNGKSLEGNHFSLTLPPGNYDIYVKPTPAGTGTDPLCGVPPQLFRNQPIKGGKVTLPLVLPAPSRFTMTLSLPKLSSVMSFEGWTARMIDPVTGRALSNPETLLAPKDTGEAFEYNVDLAFSTVVGGDKSRVGHEIVELSPPDNIDAPSFLMDRSGLQLFNSNVQVDQFSVLPTTVELEGHVEDSATLAPVKAKVTLRATELDGLEHGTIPSYIVDGGETDSQGRFKVRLFPGTYQVQAVPDDPAFAEKQVTWTVGKTPVQAGKVLDLGRGAKLTGNVTTPSGKDPLVGAPVQAVASPVKATTGVLAAATGGSPLVPRASSDVVNEHGLFTLRTDPGGFDVSIRPAEGTGFAWLVRSNVQVQSGSEDLGQMELPLPVKYSGVVSVLPNDPNTVVPGALIRAYVFLDAQQSYTSDPGAAKSVLPIAETRADSDGKFELLLPAHLD